MPAEDTSYAPRSPDLSAYARPAPQPSTSNTTYSPSYSSHYNSQSYYPAQSPSRYTSSYSQQPHTPYTSAYAAQSPSSYTPSTYFSHQQQQQQSYTPSHYGPRETYVDMPPVTRRSAAVKKEESIDPAYNSHQSHQSQTQTQVKDEFPRNDRDTYIKREQQIQPQPQPQLDEMKVEHDLEDEKHVPSIFAHIDVKTKFPVARIKRIMQADEDVGKVAQITPTAVSKALELFMISLVTQSAEIAKQKSSKKITAQHIKHVVRQTERFDFLADIIGKIPDVAPKEKEEGKEGGKESAGGKKRRRAPAGGGGGSEED